MKTGLQRTVKDKTKGVFRKSDIQDSLNTPSFYPKYPNKLKKTYARGIEPGA